MYVPFLDGFEAEGGGRGGPSDGALSQAEFVQLFTRFLEVDGHEDDDAQQGQGQDGISFVSLSPSPPRHNGRGKHGRGEGEVTELEAKAVEVLDGELSEARRTQPAYDGDGSMDAGDGGLMGPLAEVDEDELRVICASYKAKPPAVPLRVLGATLMLLGENPTWMVAQRVVGTTGSDSLVQRCAALDTRAVTPRSRSRLARVLRTPAFAVDPVVAVEPAMGPLCEWVLDRSTELGLLSEEVKRKRRKRERRKRGSERVRGGGVNAMYVAYRCVLRGYC